MMIDDRVLPGRYIGHGVLHAKMSCAYRRHQGLVRLINHIVLAFHTKSFLRLSCSSSILLGGKSVGGWWRRAIATEEEMVVIRPL
jgi:hypothetical protein